jgi:hypothetical protein
MISDDHRHDRALTRFCRMIAIHGLTIIAHHCSILITTGPSGNAKPGPKALRGGAGLPRGKSRKSANPGGRIVQVERASGISRKTLRRVVLVASSASAAPGLIIFNHHDQGRP